MKLALLLAADGTEPTKAVVEGGHNDANRLLDSAQTPSCPDVTMAGTKIAPIMPSSAVCYNLKFDDAVSLSEFRITIPVSPSGEKMRTVMFFTEHLPTEFEVAGHSMHFLKDNSGKFVEFEYASNAAVPAVSTHSSSAEKWR